jgi:hypothetical protein
MTTAWQVPSDMWRGETVAILGGAPEMNEALALSVREHKTIAVSRAIRFALWADMFVCLDASHPLWVDGFNYSGLKVCGVESDDIDALYAGMFYETITLAPGHVIEIRNNALAAIRIAALAGAAKILLLGLDARRYDALHADCGFHGFTAGLAQVTAELRAQGIEIEEQR